MLFAKGGNCNLLTCSRSLWKGNKKIAATCLELTRGKITQQVENCLSLRDYRPVFHHTFTRICPINPQDLSKTEQFRRNSTQRGERLVGFPLIQKEKGSFRMRPVEL